MWMILLDVQKVLKRRWICIKIENYIFGRVIPPQKMESKSFRIKQIDLSDRAKFRSHLE